MFYFQIFFSIQCPPDSLVFFIHLFFLEYEAGKNGYYLLPLRWKGTFTSYTAQTRLSLERSLTKMTMTRTAVMMTEMMFRFFFNKPLFVLWKMYVAKFIFIDRSSVCEKSILVLGGENLFLLSEGNSLAYASLTLYWKYIISLHSFIAFAAIINDGI